QPLKSAAIADAELEHDLHNREQALLEPQAQGENAGEGEAQQEQPSIEETVLPEDVEVRGGENDSERDHPPQPRGDCGACLDFPCHRSPPARLTPLSPTSRSRYRTSEIRLRQGV